MILDDIALTGGFSLIKGHSVKKYINNAENKDFFVNLYAKRWFVVGFKELKQIKNEVNYGNFIVIIVVNYKYYLKLEKNKKYFWYQGTDVHI